MARRMSNRDRIARMQEEADATQRERAEATPPREGKQRAAPADPERLKLVWAVKDGAGDVVATYAYGQKDSATAEAARLQLSDQRTYIVCPHKVPFDE